MPIVLFGSAFWSGLLDWMKGTMLEYGTISEADFDLMVVTDDVDEVVEIMNRHREIKLTHIEEAKQQHANDSLPQDVQDVIKHILRNNK